MKKGAAPLNWRLAFRVLMRGIGIASFVMVVLGLMSGTIRSYVSMLIDRQVACRSPMRSLATVSLRSVRGNGVSGSVLWQ
jgi:hypothetical protein